MPIRLTTQGKMRQLIVYVTVGDPDIATSHEVILAAIDAGADVVELGVPFSDPVADGPVIQRACERALKNGTSLGEVLKLAADIRRQRPDSGLIIFSYLNPIVRFGVERFAAEVALAGIDGALVTDLPLEEADDYLPMMRGKNLKTVFLAAPTSTDSRLKKIAAVSSGFIYAVSRTGVTGTQASMADDARQLVKRIKKVTKLPVAVGFGISSAEHVREVCKYADAAVVGSAIVKLIEQHGRNAPKKVAEFVKALKQ